MLRLTAVNSGEWGFRHRTDRIDFQILVLTINVNAMQIHIRLILNSILSKLLVHIRIYCFY